MTEEFDINYWAQRQQRLSKLLKRIDEQKKRVRENFFKFANSAPKEQLPQISITVPNRFFVATDLSLAEFLESRFPACDIMAVEKLPEEDETLFVLRKKPDYVPFVAEGESLQLLRSVSEFTPEVDWDTFEKVDPEIFEQLARPVQTYELDGERLQQLLKEDPTVINVIQRHTKHRKPTVRVLATEKKE